MNNDIKFQETAPKISFVKRKNFTAGKLLLQHRNTYISWLCKTQLFDVKDPLVFDQLTTLKFSFPRSRVGVNSGFHTYYGKSSIGHFANYGSLPVEMHSQGEDVSAG
jgi:membrane-anchored protein YejM (alkaline phosphatase superfamily)